MWNTGFPALQVIRHVGKEEPILVSAGSSATGVKEPATETLIHGWDLAEATDRPSNSPPAVGPRLLAYQRGGAQPRATLFGAEGA